MNKEGDRRDLTINLEKAREVVKQYYRGDDLAIFLKPLYLAAQITNNPAVVVIYQNTLVRICKYGDFQRLSCKFYQRTKLIGNNSEEILNFGRSAFTAFTKENVDQSIY